MSLKDRVEMALETVPELADSMEDMRQDSLKYNVIMNRLNGAEMADIVSTIMELQQKPTNASFLAQKFKGAMISDLHANFLRIQDDIVGGFQKMNTTGGSGEDGYKSGPSV